MASEVPKRDPEVPTPCSIHLDAVRDAWFAYFHALCDYLLATTASPDPVDPSHAEILEAIRTHVAHGFIDGVFRRPCSGRVETRVRPGERDEIAES